VLLILLFLSCHERLFVWSYDRWIRHSHQLLAALPGQAALVGLADTIEAKTRTAEKEAVDAGLGASVASWPA
jgi:hypothetical protein